MLINFNQNSHPDKKQKRLAWVGIGVILIVYVVSRFLGQFAVSPGLNAFMFAIVFMVGYFMIRWTEIIQIPKGISILSKINAVEWFMSSDEKKLSIVQELKTSTQQDNRPNSEKIATRIGMTILVLILSGSIVFLIWGVFFQEGELHF